MVGMRLPKHAPGGDLRIQPARGMPGGLVIPASELQERFSRSSGPGGQSVNTADSRVELLWDIEASTVLTAEQRDRLRDRLASRLSGGVLSVAASEHRAQLQNRSAARARLAALVAMGLQTPLQRRPTRPTKASRERRLDAKKRNAAIKAGRRHKHED